jgi:hypothetical protein
MRPPGGRISETLLHDHIHDIAAGYRIQPHSVQMAFTTTRTLSSEISLMTLPDERTRSLLWAGSFLIDVAHDSSLPLGLRRRAVTIARHFPTIEDIEWMANALTESAFSLQLAPPR